MLQNTLPLHGTLLLYHRVKRFHMSQNFVKNILQKEKQSNKNIQDSLFTTQRENETTWETRKGSVKGQYTIFNDFLE